MPQNCMTKGSGPETGSLPADTPQTPRRLPCSKLPVPPPPAPKRLHCFRTIPPGPAYPLFCQKPLMPRPPTGITPSTRRILSLHPTNPAGPKPLSLHPTKSSLRKSPPDSFEPYHQDRHIRFSAKNLSCLAPPTGIKTKENAPT
jgi:hypothetical protein